MAFQKGTFQANAFQDAGKLPFITGIWFTPSEQVELWTPIAAPGPTIGNVNFYLLDDDGSYLLDDDGAYLIVVDQGEVGIWEPVTKPTGVWQNA